MIPSFGLHNVFFHLEDMLIHQFSDIGSLVIGVAANEKRVLRQDWPWVSMGCGGVVGETGCRLVGGRWGYWWAALLHWGGDWGCFGCILV